MNWIKRIFGKKVKEEQCAIDSVSLLVLSGKAMILTVLNAKKAQGITSI
jgi:hypothetical protein